jgi:hypothetical protein
VLVDSKTGEEFEVPEDIFLPVMGLLMDDEPDPLVAELMPRLGRLYYKGTGEPFWLTDVGHSGGEHRRRGGVDSRLPLR